MGGYWLYLPLLLRHNIVINVHNETLGYGHNREELTTMIVSLQFY
jgi:hypothetical protein